MHLILTQRRGTFLLSSPYTRKNMRLQREEQFAHDDTAGGAGDERRSQWLPSLRCCHVSNGHLKQIRVKKCSYPLPQDRCLYSSLSIYASMDSRVVFYTLIYNPTLPKRLCCSNYSSFGWGESWSRTPLIYSRHCILLFI